MVGTVSPSSGIPKASVFKLRELISKDGIIPFLAPFQQLSSRGEPVRALGLTITLCEVAVLIGNSIYQSYRRLKPEMIE